MNLWARITKAWEVLNGYHLQDWSPDRQFYVNRSQDAKRDIPYAVRRKMLDWAREMERKDPIFNRYLDLCEQYVIGPTGIRLLSASTNRDWAKAADAEWEDWQPWCDISSRQSFGQRQSLVERDTEVAGEAFIYLTYGSTGRPRIQLIASEEVETPPKLANEKAVFDGVRQDELGRALGYFVKTGDKNFTEIAAEQIVHSMEPSRIGQVRGLTVCYPVLDAMLDLKESIEN